MTVWLRSTTSTMLDATVLAEKGEPHGTVVVAESQTGGIGRHGHEWHSADTGGLYVSIILRLERPPDELPIVTMALGLAVQAAVNGATGLASDIRWPNDLMLNGRKAAGVIAQLTSPGVMIAGIGLNVNQTEFPDELGSLATSLRIETDREFDKPAILDSLVAECLYWAVQPKAKIIAEFEKNSTWAKGKCVEVDGRWHGVTAGLDPNGFLLVATPAGTETVLSGGVREVTM